MTTHHRTPAIFPPTVDAPFASWHEIASEWVGHPTLDAAAQYSRRNGVASPKIWERISHEFTEVGERIWIQCAAPRRPYGSRSGQSYLSRLVVLMPGSLVRELDEQRGLMSRSAFAREAIERWCVALRWSAIRPGDSDGRLVSCQDAHGERDNVRNGTNEACKLCACSVAAPGCMLVP